jgi:hypothetical protein
VENVQYWHLDQGQHDDEDSATHPRTPVPLCFSQREEREAGEWEEERGGPEMTMRQAIH